MFIGIGRQLAPTQSMMDSWPAGRPEMILFHTRFWGTRAIISLNLDCTDRESRWSFHWAMCDYLNLASHFYFSFDFEFLSSTSDDDDLTTASNTETCSSGIQCLLYKISRQDTSLELRGSTKEEIVDRQDSLAFSTICERYGRLRTSGWKRNDSVASLRS